VSAFGKKSKILFKTHTVVKDERITAEKWHKGVDFDDFILGMLLV
jgi:hypothetical protein